MSLLRLQMYIFKTKTKQYTAINAVTKSRHDQKPLAGNAIVMKASIETASEWSVHMTS